MFLESELRWHEWEWADMNLTEDKKRENRRNTISILHPPYEKRITKTLPNQAKKKSGKQIGIDIVITTR